ncbi:MAG: hypothetical protein ACRDD8_08195 [Bacteroidales bacterium]
MKINKIHKRHYSGNVYNIGVRNNHNYFVNNLLVSNCYVSANQAGRFYEDIVKKAELFFGSMSENDKPLQIAIGSQGEPTIHPEFLEFIAKVYDLNIVPNYTTNGLTIATDDAYSEQLLEHTAKYCGGVAVSCNNYNTSIDATWRKAVDKLSKIDININLHIIISDKESVDRFIDIYNEFKDKVYYFVLLPLMPSGRSTDKYTEEAFNYMVESVNKLDTNKVAFGAHFYDNLKTKDCKKLLPTYTYPPEHFSANLVLDNPIRITPSSFDINTTLLSVDV